MRHRKRQATGVNATLSRLIDLGGLQLTGERRAQVVEEIRAGAQAGVFTVTNFGLSEGLMDRLRKVTHDYFSQAMLEEIARTDVIKGVARPNWGYEYKQSKEKDHVQQHRLTFRMAMAPEERRSVNVWPSDEFREAALEFQEELQPLCEVVEHEVKNADVGVRCEALRGEGYPVLAIEQLTRIVAEQRVGNGCLAYAVQDVGRVQAQCLGHELCHVASCPHRPKRDVSIVHPYGLCVIVGDCLETLSNGRYFSAPHRVKVNTSREDRLSFLSIFDAQPDAVLQPHPDLITQEYPDRYRTRTLGERLAEVVSPTMTIADITKNHMFHKPEFVDKTRNLNVDSGILVAGVN